ncbi:MAG: YbbR-like domain-containing protein, partial [Thermodesulfobacteria bacterium]|nr:YbbR-like domain-containing protein [Thermodesulfobacteriota bacterium]
MNPLDFFSKNIFLKLLSLAFAVLLWFFVVLEDKVEQAVQVEIRVKNVPEKLILVKPPPKTITVYVTGPRSILRNLTHRPLVLTLDLEDFKPGSHTIFFREKDIDLPAGLKVIKIEPSQVEIVLEREV